MKRIAISTTVPVEVILAAGYKPVDLNNTFVTSDRAEQWLESAEFKGFPKSMCAWIKGLYSACHAEKPDVFLAVTEGDCSNSIGLHQVLAHDGVKTLSFGFPQTKQAEALYLAIDQLAQTLGTTMEAAEQYRKRLIPLRLMGQTLDRLTFETGQVSGFENHLWLVSFSDFNGDPAQFETDLSNFLVNAVKRPVRPPKLRLGYVGVPPMIADLYDFVETLEAQVVYNEVQRQFSMPFAGGVTSLTQQYLAYTYPYELSYRIEDIENAIEERQLDGIIHYTQAFCHRALDDILLKSKIKLPILTLEGDKSTVMDGRTKLRLEAFIDMLKAQKRGV